MQNPDHFGRKPVRKAMRTCLFPDAEGSGGAKRGDLKVSIIDIALDGGQDLGQWQFERNNDGVGHEGQSIKGNRHPLGLVGKRLFHVHNGLRKDWDSDCGDEKNQF